MEIFFWIGSVIIVVWGIYHFTLGKIVRAAEIESLERAARRGDEVALRELVRRGVLSEHHLPFHMRSQ